MSFFRRHLAWEQAEVRPAAARDRDPLAALLLNADHRILSASNEETVALALGEPTLVLASGAKVLAALGSGWRTPPVAWLRTAVFDARVPVEGALGRLLPPLYDQLRAEQIELFAVTVDDWNWPWLSGPLERLGFAQMVDVIGYQKLRMNIPDRGNQQVVVRTAQPADLAAVLALDSACFPLPWVKGAEILGPAIASSPCFLVAERDGQPAGYAFATVHYSGRLVHLVRIAVDPALQGQAIGVRLLAEVVNYCAMHGTSLLSLNTQSDNLHAQRLYEWFGFAKTDERQRVFGAPLVSR